jgi:DNA-directed RNA polymerase subunit RPC12/RpoP
MTTFSRLQWWFKFLVAGLLGVGALSTSWHATWLNHGFRAGVLGFLGVAVLTLFVLGFRCPSCRHSLLLRAATILSTRGPHACSRCGASLHDRRDARG